MGYRRALARLAALTRIELVRARLAPGDVLAAKESLSETGHLLREDCDFGSLNDDACELSAMVRQIQATSAGRPKLTPAELRLLPLLVTQLSFGEIPTSCLSRSHRQGAGDLDLPQACRLLPHASH